MSLSITLTYEDTQKLVDTANLLDLLFSMLGRNDTLSFAINKEIPIDYVPEEIEQLSSWYRNLIQVLKYAGTSSEEVLPIS